MRTSLRNLAHTVSHLEVVATGAEAEGPAQLPIGGLLPADHDNVTHRVMLNQFRYGNAALTEVQMMYEAMTAHYYFKKVRMCTRVQASSIAGTLLKRWIENHSSVRFGSIAQQHCPNRAGWSGCLVVQRAARGWLRRFRET